MAITIPVKTTFDGKGFDDAERAAKRLQQQQIAATRAQIAEHRKVQQITSKLDKDLAAGKAAQIQQMKDWGAAGLVAGGIIFTAGMKAVDAARESIAAEAQLAATIKSTGGAAGQSSEALIAHANALQDITNFSDDAIMDGQGLLLTFTGIKETFPEATKTMLDMSTAMDQDLKSSALQLGKALNNPIEGISALTRIGVTFTDQQKEQIKTMVESGRIADAQRVILAELNREFGGSAEAARIAAGGQKSLEVSSGKLEEAMGRLMLSIGDQGVTGEIVKLLDALTIGAESWTTAVERVGLLSSALRILKKDTNQTKAQVNELTGGLYGFLDAAGKVASFGLSDIGELAGAALLNPEIPGAIQQVAAQQAAPKMTPAPKSTPFKKPGSSIYGFADGGMFTVGGFGGADSQLVQFMASPGEKVSITPPGQGGVTINQTINGGNEDLARRIAQVTQAAAEAEIDRFYSEVIVPWSQGL